MDCVKLTLEPASDFGTPLVGDTLFGHLCWALRWRQGEQALATLLQGYTEGRPFAVVSDAFSAGWLPKPSLPLARLGVVGSAADRKADKARVWLPAEDAALPLAQWCLRAAAQPGSTASARLGIVTQNTINRMTGTTGTGAFAPRQVERIVHPPGARLEVYVLLDGSRLPRNLLLQALTDVGQAGYGRDASTGLGKFSVNALESWSWRAGAGAKHGLTLSACAPDPAELEAGDCHYQPVTRFGRHGSVHVHTGQPFKRPLLLLRTAAVLAFMARGVPAFHGRGLGGLQAPISDAEPATVHQGYAPLVPLHLPDLAEPRGDAA